MGKYVVIEDLDSFDCYSVMSRKDYKKAYSDKKILFSGDAEKCNDWVMDNPHPNANDYKVFFDGEDADVDNTGFFI